MKISWQVKTTGGLLKVLGLTLVLALPCLNQAQAQRTRNLAEDSPFLPPGYKKNLAAQKKKAAPPPKSPPRLKQNLELRGYVRIGGVWKFSIFDKRTNKSQWLALNERADGAGFSIVEFDTNNRDVVVKDGGEQATLSIKEPSGNPVPIAHLKAAARKPAPKPKTPVKPTVRKPTPQKPGTPVPRRRIVTPSNR